MGWFLRSLLAPVFVLLTARGRSLRQQALLLTMAAAIEKRIPLTSLLEALADDAWGSWRSKVQNLANLLEEGTPLIDALDAVPGLFPPDVVVQVQVAASAGRAQVGLRDAASRLARQSDNAPWPTGASLLYVLAIGGMLLSVGGFIMYWIIPKFKSIFEGFDVELPAMTVALIHVSNFIVNYFYLAVFPAVALAVCAAAVLTALEGFRPSGVRGVGWVTRFFPRSKTPVVLRCLSFALEGRQPIPQTLSEMASRHPQYEFRSLMTRICETVELGGDVWESLWGHGLLKRGEVAVLNSAQRAGNLPWALRALAETIERRIEVRLKITVELLRPIGILCAGGVVALFVMSMFLPLVQLLHNLA